MPTHRVEAAAEGVPDLQQRPICLRRLNRRTAALGYSIRKFRDEDGYCIVDVETNSIVAGAAWFDLELEHCEGWIAEVEAA